MILHHLRSATFVIESGERFILIDPMLGPKGSLPPFAFLRFKARKNPTVELPSGADAILGKVTHTLQTHSQKWGIEPLTHSDHLDRAGKALLRDRSIPVATLARDAAYLHKLGIDVACPLEYWEEQPFAGGKIVAVPAQHGHGWNHKLMANGAGYFLRLADEPSIYISGDTVLTADVERALAEYQPDIAVVAAGSAQMDIGPPILMTLDEIIRFVELAPGHVYANHLEALNHCPTTRMQLRDALGAKGLLEKVWVPEDGESRECNQ